ncbi:MAG: S41 family peptidase [Anaerolineales bacterium]|nr:S41 family peptidase [Anaerolineales bacterium]
MRKPVLITVLGLILACLFITGAFGAGILAGRAFFAIESVSESAPAPMIETTEPLQLPQGDQAEPLEPEAIAPTLPPNHPEVNLPPGAPSQELDQLFEPFWEAWDIVHQLYVDQPIDDDALLQGAIEGMLEALGDQHTSYMDPSDFEQANMRIDGDYEGIGAWVDTSGDYLTIISPMPGSPAEAAGLEPGDEIIAIDGEDMTGIDPNLVIRRVLGPADSKVILTIQRAGVRQPFDVEVTRDRIVIPSIDYRMLDSGVAYIQLFDFAEETGPDLQAALEELLADNPAGLILDLRNNPGGLLSTAVEVTSQFIPEGEVVLYQESGDGSREVYTSIRGGLALDIPMVILVNEGSASASEIVAGALQDYGRATLLGTTTFGKGSVQRWIPLSNEGAVRVTISRWLTPNERQIQGQGLTPDISLAVVSQAAIDEGFDVSFYDLPEDQIIILSAEQIEAEEDPQLDRAVEILLGE